jgi:hypothetical protein
MSHKNKKSLVKQTEDMLQSKQKIGFSRHDDKAIGIAHKYIYSYSTYRAYLEECCRFAKWCKAAYGVKTIDECSEYVNVYIKTLIDAGRSAYTIKKVVASICKLYGTHSSDYIPTPSRLRQNIVRSRGERVRDRHFSVSRNQDLVTFASCTGLRRRELASLKVEDGLMKYDEASGLWYLNIKHGTKGGRERSVPILGTPEEVNFIIEMLNKSKNYVFPRGINSNCDVHHLRSVYANKAYAYYMTEHSIPDPNERYIIRKNSITEKYISETGDADFDRYKQFYIRQPDGSLRMKAGYRDVPALYVCRRDKNDEYSREALFWVSKALGHNRESVLAEHYLI